MLAGTPTTVKRARRLRRDMSVPEVMLWVRLRLRPGGYKFRRQHPAGPYILDFFCNDARMAIEVDGVVMIWVIGPNGIGPGTNGWRRTMSL